MAALSSIGMTKGGAEHSLLFNAKESRGAFHLNILDRQTDCQTNQLPVQTLTSQITFFRTGSSLANKQSL